MHVNPKHPSAKDWGEGKRPGQDLLGHCQPTKSFRDKPRRQNAPGQHRLGGVSPRGPGLPACRVLWFKSHLKIACGYKACWLLGPRWNSAGKRAGRPHNSHPFSLGSFLVLSISQGNLHVPILSFSYLSIPYHRWGNRGTEMQGLAWGLVAIEEPGCVEERPVAASLAGSLPPDALGL